ncbi:MULTISPECIES: 3D domain-containing protein [unclassified Sporolactobacillus]|uniref:3D domain-containing protein n=1 Tax=unclassified Sporolactobacillus TaxID=2628533 RepID=UPI002368685E|nr:3D domain-containing protein [Sporolactobacillus sp. CQH2019]MDD9147508.1 3D domain-containing protein [Sporolactobacillus sp. CQH2019]
MKKMILLLITVVFLLSGFSNVASAKSSSVKLTVQATAYCELGRTATGFDLSKNPNAKVIAVDPRVIPLGSKVYIPGYGTAVARDTGGRIKGHIIDVHLRSHAQAIKWGRKKVNIIVYRR